MTKKEVDDELAVRRVSPVLDHGLGSLLVFLILLFVNWAYAQREAQPALLLHFALAMVFTIFAISAVGFVAAAVGRVISDSRGGPHIPKECRHPLAGPIVQKKWKDQAWQLTIHFCMSVWEIRLLMQNQRWWEDPRTCFQPCPLSDAAAGAYVGEIRLFYVLQLALWMWTGVSCKWLEERRKDYLEMMAHHCLTVALILNSFMNNELPIGLVVMAVHDISDVVLDLMKMANYLKLEDAHGYFIVEFWFLVNTFVSWPYLRLYVFPLFVIHAVTHGYHENCCTNCGVNAGNPLADFPNNLWPDIPGWGRASSFLTALFFLHCMWWLLLVRIGVKLIVGVKANQAADEEYEVAGKNSSLIFRANEEKNKTA